MPHDHMVELISQQTSSVSLFKYSPEEGFSVRGIDRQFRDNSLCVENAISRIPMRSENTQILGYG